MKKLLNHTSILLITALSSCSNVIYKSLPHADVLQPNSTKTAIRHALGSPNKTGITNNNFGSYYANREFDQFQVTGAVYDREQERIADLGFVLSFGTSGITMIPDAIKTKRSKSQKTVTVIYDQTDQYLDHRVQEFYQR